MQGNVTAVWSNTEVYFINSTPDNESEVRPMIVSFMFLLLHRPLPRFLPHLFCHYYDVMSLFVIKC